MKMANQPRCIGIISGANGGGANGGGGVGGSGGNEGAHLVPGGAGGINMLVVQCATVSGQHSTSTDLPSRARTAQATTGRANVFGPSAVSSASGPHQLSVEIHSEDRPRSRLFGAQRKIGDANLPPTRTTQTHNDGRQPRRASTSASAVTVFPNPGSSHNIPPCES